MEIEYESEEYAEADHLLTKFVYYYCLYKLSLKTKYKDFRRSSRYSYLDNMVTCIDSIIDEDENYKDILIQQTKYNEIDIMRQKADKIISEICDALDFGTWEICTKDDGTEYLHQDIVEYVLEDINIEKMLTKEYIEELRKLQGKEGRLKSEYEMKHRKERYGRIR